MLRGKNFGFLRSRDGKKGKREGGRKGGEVGVKPVLFNRPFRFWVRRVIPSWARPSDKAGKKDTNYCQHLLGHVFITHKLKDKRKEILNPFPDF